MAIVNYRETYGKYSRYFKQLTDTYNGNSQVKESVELLLTLLTISFFIVFALRPTANTISELISNINSQKEIKEKLDTKLTNLEKARQNFSKSEKDIVLVDQALPQTPTPDLYVQQIEGFASAHSLTLKSLSVSETLLYGVPPKDRQQDAEKKEKIPGVKGANIAFVVSGSFEDISLFLDDIENLRQMLLIETYSLGIAKNSDSGKNITLSVSGLVPSFSKNEK